MANQFLGNVGRFVRTKLTVGWDLGDLDVLSSNWNRNKLHIAVFDDDLQLAQRLLLIRPDMVLKQDGLGFTPLHLAALQGSFEMVKILVSANIEALQIQDTLRRRPLHMAVINNRLDVMSLLLKEDSSGQAVGSKVDKQNSILHFYLLSNEAEAKVDTFELLVEHLPANEVNTINNDTDSKSVFQLAVDKKATEITRYMMQRVAIDAGEFQKQLDELEKEENKEEKKQFYGYDAESILKKKGRKIPSHKERHHLRGQMGQLSVIAVLLVGIACAGISSPPGGVWGEDSKIDPASDPVIFSYYMKHMVTTHELGKAFKRNNKVWNITNHGDMEIRNLLNFLESLMGLWGPKYSKVITKGLVLQDTLFINTVSDYTNMNINGSDLPYIIRYAGVPVLAYAYPVHMAIFMVTNGMALYLSLILLFLLISGFITDTSLWQVRCSIALTCFSVACMGLGYLSMALAMLQSFYERAYLLYQVLAMFFGCVSFLGVLYFISKMIYKLAKLRRKYRIGFCYYMRAVFFDIEFKTLGKLFLLCICYVVFRLKAFVYSGTWSNWHILLF